MWILAFAIGEIGGTAAPNFFPDYLKTCRNRSASSSSLTVIEIRIEGSGVGSANKRPPTDFRDLHAGNLFARPPATTRSACTVANPKPISTASRLLLSNSVHIRHEQSIGHSLLKMPDHRRLDSRYRNRQRLALGRPKLDDVSAVGLGAEDHDPVLAGSGHRLSLFSLSRSR